MIVHSTTEQTAHASTREGENCEDLGEIRESALQTSEARAVSAKVLRQACAWCLVGLRKIKVEGLECSEQGRWNQELSWQRNWATSQATVRTSVLLHSLEVVLRLKEVDMKM
jgi:hypothetical protein